MFNSKLAGALAVFIAVAVAPQAVAAGPANDSGTPLRAAADAYRAAYPQMSPAAAEAAAADQPSRKALYDSIAPERFGGAWYDPPSNTVHVAATTAETADAALRRGRELGLRIETKLVPRSFAELERHAESLRAGAGPLGAAAKGQVGIDVETNRVVVAVAPAQRAALTAGGEPAGVKVIDDPGTVAQPDVCDARDNCDTGVRAGAMLWRTNIGNETCSVGFTGRDFSTDVRWTITAGHCSNGFLVDWGTVEETIGPLFATMDAGAVDASAILINNPRYTNDLGGRIYRDAAFGGIVDVNAVAGTLADIVAGDTVCLAANFTEVNGPNLCGVIGTNSDAAVRGMARVDGVDACGGDSGGGWYSLSGSTRTAYGFHSRSDTGCHGAAATADSWFSPWPTVQSALLPGLDIEIR